MKFNIPYQVDLTDFDQSVDYKDQVHDYFNGHGYLVNTCTAALEMIALAMDIQVGDEIILPAFTYVTTASAFALRGARLVFVDVDDDMLLDIEKAKKAITGKTKAIVYVHYAGTSRSLGDFRHLCDTERLLLIEDAAQAIGQDLGTFGDFVCYSFHETKNIHSFEGGYLVVNNACYHSVCDMIFDKGTDRKAFINREVSKYTWQCLGSSFEMDNLRAFVLIDQLSKLDLITKHRQSLVKAYQVGLSHLKGFTYPNHNGHLFYVLVDDRQALTNYLSDRMIDARSHYEPLHLSEAGKRFGRVVGVMDKTMLAKKLLRLPVHHKMTLDDVWHVVKTIKEYYE